MMNVIVLVVMIVMNHDPDEPSFGFDSDIDSYQKCHRYATVLNLFHLMTANIPFGASHVT